MSDRTFTLEEAQTLLPILESLLRAAISGKNLMEETEAEMQALQHRIFLNGGTHVDVVAVARRKAERTKAEQRAKDALAEIDSIGVQVKDLDIGLLDFPCEVEGRVVLLCWKMGEDEGCLGGLTTGAGEIAEWRKIGAEDLGVAVDDVEGFGHLESGAQLKERAPTPALPLSTGGGG